MGWDGIAADEHRIRERRRPGPTTGAPLMSDSEVIMIRGLVLSLLLVLSLVSASAGNPSLYYARVDLDGSQVVPPTSSAATGWLQVFPGGGPEWGYPGVYSACYDGITDTVTSVTICEGGPGVNGPVLYTPYTGGFGCEAEVQPAVWSEQAWSDGFSGYLYVLVNTLGYPNGEIRGQLQLQWYEPTRKVSWGSVKTTFR